MLLGADLAEAAPVEAVCVFVIPMGSGISVTVVNSLPRRIFSRIGSGLVRTASKWPMGSSEIEVPLMGCNSTVDVKSREVVENEMPEEFYSWLQMKITTT